MNSSTLLHRESHEFDVCVIGGGMSGLCAAIASARNGARTALVHERPVLGGNASSEIRMWICGARGPHNKEAGILEEIQLENQYLNPTGHYSIWDSVLYAKAQFQPGLTVFFNTSCVDAGMEGDRIGTVTAWQLTSQTWNTIRARHFVDCSGDSILAALTGAGFRVGREARAEFDEDIEPVLADLKTMGNTLLIQIRRTDEPHPFVAPAWAYKFEKPEDLEHRVRGVNGDNFWWIEVGGLADTIRDAEQIRDELMRITYGVWDYIKNVSPEREKAETWAIEWIGSLPGKRENRRYIGDHTLTQNDVAAGGEFPDVVAYGGWPMDDHHPAGLLYPGEPTIFHPAPSPYGIPYRCLYSRNIANLHFAGRNISVTHAALSSTRVMATCSLLGQAAGTAAALCVRFDCAPRAMASGDKLDVLQRTLQDDDCWLPGFTRPVSDLANAARLSGDGENLAALIDGTDRDRPDEVHACTLPPGGSVEFRWDEPVHLGGIRLVFDSDFTLNKRMPCTYPLKGTRCAVPQTLVKSFRIEVLDDAGGWLPVVSEALNYQRLVRSVVDRTTTACRLTVLTTWGAPEARVFAFEPVPIIPDPAKLARVPEGPTISQVREASDPADLAPPDSIVTPGRAFPGISA